MTPLGPPDPSKKGVTKKKHAILRFFGNFSVVFCSFSWFFINKMRFLAENVCFSVLATKISYLQQKIFRFAQHDFGRLRLSWQKFFCYS